MVGTALGDREASVGRQRRNPQAGPKIDQAEKELRLAIVADPDEPYAFSLLAMALWKQKKHSDAIAIAKQGVHLSPDWVFTHYVLSAVLDEQRSNR